MRHSHTSRTRASGRTQRRRATPDRVPASCELSLQIESLTLEGRGVARHQGKTIFVEGALPGERVTARIHSQHSRYDEAQTLSIEQASDERCPPVCDHYGQCGGCNLQHLQPDAALRWRETLVLEQLQRHARLVPEQLEPPLQDATQHYRRSARIGINMRQRDGELLAGFRRRGSARLIHIDRCPVLDRRLHSLFNRIRRELHDCGDLKAITHLDVSLGDGNGALCWRVIRPLPRSVINRLQTIGSDLRLSSWLEHDDQVFECLDEQPTELSYRLQQNSLELRFMPGDFLQVNAEINRQLVSRAVEWLNPTAEDRVLDLFCGLGNFSLPLAQQAGHVVGVEGSRTMVERARQNAQRNQLENTAFFRADLSSDLSGYSWMQPPPDLILLDPPRSGAQALIPSLLATGARRILYIACNPAALVRDSVSLTEGGYRLTRFCIADMFPQTSHVESLALFERSAKKKS